MITLRASGAEFDPRALDARAAISAAMADATQQLRASSSFVPPTAAHLCELAEATRAGLCALAQVLLQPDPRVATLQARVDELLAANTREAQWRQRLCCEAAVSRANREALWGALAMVREALELLGPVGALPASEHLPNCGTEPHHEAEALIAGIQLIIAERDKSDAALLACREHLVDCIGDEDFADSDLGKQVNAALGDEA